VKRLLALLAGGLGLRALLRRWRGPTLGPSPAAGLRAKLDETRGAAPGPELETELETEPEAEPETEPAPQTEPAPETRARPREDEDARRADVHARARQAIENLGEPLPKEPRGAPEASED
jgi:hypothetical protein